MLKLVTIIVYKVVFRDLNVRVKYCGDEAVFSFDLSVHLLNVRLSKVLRVEAEVFVAVRLSVIIGPLNIHNEDIDWKIEISKVLVSLPENIRRNNVILGEVEAKGMAGR